MKDFKRVNSCGSRGKQKNRVRAISPLESSLSEKRMKWGKGSNMPCGCHRDKRQHQSLANKKQTMAWSQPASFGQSSLWRGLEPNGSAGPNLDFCRRMRVCPALLCSSLGKPFGKRTQNKLPTKLRPFVYKAVTGSGSSGNLINHELLPHPII